LYPVVLFLYFAFCWLLYLYPPFLKGVQGTTNHAGKKTTGLYPAKRMKMDLETLKQRIDLTALAGTALHRRGMYSVGPCPFCGGTERFVVKHAPDGDLWLCRKCGDDQKYHSAIEFIMRRDHLPFKAALAVLGGEPPTKTSFPRGKSLPSTDWQTGTLRGSAPRLIRCCTSRRAGRPVPGSQRAACLRPHGRHGSSGSWFMPLSTDRRPASPSSLCRGTSGMRTARW
jgi:hypothetical protein